MKITITVLLAAYLLCFAAIIAVGVLIRRENDKQENGNRKEKTGKHHKNRRL